MQVARNDDDRLGVVRCDTQPASFKDAARRWGDRIETMLEQ